MTSIRRFRPGKRPHGFVRPPTVAVTVAEVLTSDSFARADGAVNGSSTDAALGGSALVWTAAPAVVVLAGKLARSSATNVQTSVDVGRSDHEVSVKIDALPAAGSDAVHLWGRVNGTAALSDSYRAAVTTAGAINLLRFVGGTSTTIGSLAAGTVTAGKTVTLKVTGSTISVAVDGVELLSVNDPDHAVGTRAGVRWQGTGGTASRLDDFVVKAA